MAEAMQAALKWGPRTVYLILDPLAVSTVALSKQFENRGILRYPSFVFYSLFETPCISRCVPLYLSLSSLPLLASWQLNINLRRTE
jgi:hypothetical protein